MIHALFFCIRGPICYASCLAVVGGGRFIAGAAILLGFTSSGISAGSWATSWKASYAGSIPERCRYAHQPQYHGAHLVLYLDFVLLHAPYFLKEKK